MFQHSKKSSEKNNEHQYKIYSYIATFGLSEMINQRIKKASEWLNHPSSLFYARTFYEADQSIHRQNYDLIITDNESYYKLIEHLPVFKIKIEQDFFSNDDDPLLSAKPLYYHPEKNTLFIREQSSHNSRFLYEILRIALTPPVITIYTHQTLENIPQNLHDFRQVRNRIHTVFPYIKLCNSTDEHCPQHLVPDYCPPLQCYVQADDNILLAYLEDNTEKIFSLNKQKETIDFLWYINQLLEKKGCLSFYNDYDEIVRHYN
ncbi:MAG TPA: hypothetical protein ENJ33_07255 [Thiothrix sp.]|nr:hypothetical protein [Thiothrix sp.]